MAKRTAGRRKIEMKKIESEDARRIALSKRRSGLFKKASEIATLCGVQIAIIVYSIGGKAFTFGHPTIESVISRFENANQPEDDYITSLANSIREGRIQGLNDQFNALRAKMEEVKEKKAQNRMLFENLGCQSFEDFIDKLDPSELEQVKEKMENMKLYLAQNYKEIYGFKAPLDWLKM